MFQPQAHCNIEPWDLQFKDSSQHIHFNISHFADMSTLIECLCGHLRIQINLFHQGEKKEVLQVKMKSNCIQLQESSMNLVLWEIMKVQRHTKMTLTHFLTLRSSPSSEKTSHKSTRKTQYDGQYKMRQEPRAKPELSPKLVKLELTVEISVISHQEKKGRKSISSRGNNLCSEIEV